MWVGWGGVIGSFFGIRMMLREKAATRCRNRVLGIILLFVVLVPAAALGGDGAWVVSTSPGRWVNQAAGPGTASAGPVGERVGMPATQPDLAGDMVEPTGPLVIVVDPGASGQRIEGFGGCFNAMGWRALVRLDEVDRDRVMRALFVEKEGLGLNFGRVPIGASDFALSPYSLDDVAGDLEMKQFSIERDRYMLIPFIKAALRIRPDLKIWGSPWSPPGWMKTSGVYHGGTLVQDPEILKAYAIYLAKFVEEYHREGIDIFAVNFQNEPAEDQKYPSCPWKEPETVRDFIRDYAGPTFAERKVPAKIWLGTITNNKLGWFETILNDQDVMKTIGGLGIQYASRDIAGQKLHERISEFADDGDRDQVLQRA